MNAGAAGWVLPLVAGTVSFLSPCVLALVPGYISFISGVAVQDLSRSGPESRRHVLARSVLFFLGFTVVFVLLGASASAMGAVLTAYRPLLNRLFGVLIVVMGLHLMGVLRLAALYRERRIGLRLQQAGPVTTVLVGMAFAFAWTPCVGPILATILLYAGSTGTVTTGAAMLAIYSLGLGIPFVLAGVGVTRLLHVFGRLRRFGAVVERASGVALAGVGVLLVTNRMFYVSVMAQRLFSRLGLDLWRFF